MPSFQNLSNRIFNNLTTSKEHETRIISNRKRVFWKCTCSCGKEVWVHSNSLLSGHTKSCGCLCGKNVRLPEGEAHKNSIYLQAKLGAQARGIKWNLTKEQYFEVASQNCYYCGIEPIVKAPSKGKSLNGLVKSNGIDRLDSNKGYVKDNCVPCCWIHNRMKGVLSLEAFIRECKQIAKRFDNVNNGIE